MESDRIQLLDRTGKVQKRTHRNPQWVRPPRQQRSDESLRRIIAASKKLMERKSFFDISVAEIVKEARSSIGVFYSRFPDKLALLHHLDELFAREAEEAIDTNFRYENWKDSSFEEVSREVIGFLCRSHYENRGMLKSIILEVRMNPNQRFQQTGKRLAEAIGRIADFLLNWRQEIAHTQPDRLLRLGLMMSISLIRDFIVFAETTHYQELLDPGLGDLQSLLADSFRRITSGIPTASK